MITKAVLSGYASELKKIFRYRQLWKAQKIEDNFGGYL